MLKISQPGKEMDKLTDPSRSRSFRLGANGSSLAIRHLLNWVDTAKVFLCWQFNWVDTAKGFFLLAVQLGRYCEGVFYAGSSTG